MIKHDHPDKLTVCIIVKNEEKTIKACLDSTREIADQTVIVDTGSTDKTLKVISDGAYKNTHLIRSKWNNNFSYARNLSLKHASNGWILWVDADDVIPPKSIPLIKKLKTYPLDSFFYFDIVNTDRGLPTGPHFLQCRMFPNSDQIYFENPVHEQISPSCIARGLKACQVTNVKVHHTGYENDELKKVKSNRNIALMKSIPNYSKSPYWLKHIGDSYQMGMDHRSAYDYYLAALLLFESAEIYSKLGSCKMFLEDWDAAEKYFRLGLEKDPESVEMTYHLAKVYECSQNWEKAIIYYEKVLELPDRMDVSTSFFDQARIYTFHYLLRIYTAFRMNNEALLLVTKLNLYYPKHKVTDDKF